MIFPRFADRSRPPMIVNRYTDICTYYGHWNISFYTEIMFSRKTESISETTCKRTGKITGNNYASCFNNILISLLAPPRIIPTPAGEIALGSK